MSGHEETKEERDKRFVQEALQRIKTDETNLYVGLIKLRNLIGDNTIKTEIRSVLDTLRERLNKLDRMTRK